MSKGLVYYKLYKPYGFLSQFSGESNDKLLGELFPFPINVYPVGRLDKDSEGLLLLTNDNSFKHKLLDPSSNKHKVYWVQVDGEITAEAVEKLRSGTIEIKHKGKPYTVRKAECKRIDAPSIEDRQPPIRFRKEIPTSWIELTITEGKNRQVRKMTAAVGFPTLRLVRVNIENYSIEGMKPGDCNEICP
jgi:23S rRNA pseudouridine2457 synthase